MALATDPVTGISDAVTEVAQLVDDMSAKEHPLLYMWRIHRLTNFIVRDCKKNKGLRPDDIVGAECADLAAAEQVFILHVVKEKLGMIL